MPKLTETERQILSALTEDCRLHPDDIASAVFPDGYGVKPRKYSNKSTERLMDLLEAGYVETRGACWVRTPAGTEALKEAENV